MIAGEHLGDLLSAHLDGELQGEEIAMVEGHLASCADCRAELDAISSVRTAVRAAPAVEPPFGFYERALRAGAPGAPRGGRARTWGAAAAVVGVAAAWLLVIGMASDPRGEREAPQVEAVRATLSTPAGQAAGSATGEIPLPSEINGLKRGPAFKTRDGGTVVVFGDSPRSWIGVQTTPGKVDWSKLTGGLRKPVDGIPGEPWRSIEPGAMPAIVYESNGVGVTVAGPVDEATLEDVARQLPAPEDPSLADRLLQGVQSLYDGW